MALNPLGRIALAIAIVLMLPLPAVGQQESGLTLRNDSLIVRFVNVDVRTAIQALGRHLDRPIAFSDVGDGRITLETPQPVPRSHAIHLLESVLESQNLELIVDSATYRIQRSGRAQTKSAPGGVDDAMIELFVIRLRHANATDVAATVNALYGRPSALGEIGGRPATLADQLGQNRLPPTDAPPATPSLTGGRAAAFSGDVTIVPDASTNSLLVRASRRDFELIEAAIAQLDVRPLQVLIEVLIAEVRRDRNFALGLELGLDTVNIPRSIGLDGRVSGSNAGLGLGDFVLRLMNVGGIELDATLRAAAGRGDVRIVSRPVVLAANNETAKILVGSQRPFVQVSRSLPTDVPTRDQVVQYKDVGTQLTVHPTISSDGYVMLEVTQEVNAATTETAFDAPVISTRSVQTRLLVKDGQTVALGGLTDRQRDRNRRGIPILSRLPLIGGLFGSTSNHMSETDLMLFLTPRIIRTDDDVQQVTEPLREKAERINP